MSMKRFLCFPLLLAALSTTSFAATEQEVVNECAATLRHFRTMPESAIPAGVLRNARGLAIMTVVKAGFVFSGKGGQGVVVARTDNGWSGPSFVGTGGAGWGLQIGAQRTEFVFVLNTDAAVRAFSRDGNVTLGADVSATAGPVGRDLAGRHHPARRDLHLQPEPGIIRGRFPGRRDHRHPKNRERALLRPTRARAEHPGGSDRTAARRASTARGSATLTSPHLPLQNGAAFVTVHSCASSFSRSFL